MRFLSMRIPVILLYTAFEIRHVASKLHWLEEHHFPTREFPPDTVKGEKVPDHKLESPDYRMEGDDAWVAHKGDWWLEENRPYRLSPFYKQAYRWKQTRTGGWFVYIQEDPSYLGCYCTTVYKRFTLLAGCAVITTRHILTTASSTELVLKRYKHLKNLDNILGAWYDNNENSFNSSMYTTPARIHYHPQFVRPHEVNISHPLPFMYDLAVWAATRTFYFTLLVPISPSAVICQRGGPGADSVSSTPKRNELAHIVGFQFVKAQRKIPMPWMRYVVRTRDHYTQCPKIEWGWFHCIKGHNVWSKYGVDSGAAWHRQVERKRYVYDGLIGMCAFTMKLRSDGNAHYFTVLNTHPVMDFLYDAYMGWKPYEYLDDRYVNSRGRAPLKKGYWWGSIFYDFFNQDEKGDERLYGFELPWY